MGITANREDEQQFYLHTKHELYLHQERQGADVAEEIPRSNPDQAEGNGATSLITK